MPLAALLILVAPGVAIAQAPDGGANPDGGFDVPDGSVGEGGADRDNEEAEDRTGRVPTVCSESYDCAPGFACRDRRCVYIGIRKAEGGFGCGGLATPLGAIPLAAVLLHLRRRRQPRGRGP